MFEIIITWPDFQHYRQGPGVPRPIPPRQTQVPVWRHDVRQFL